MRRKLQGKVQEMKEALDAANNRINSLEKARLRLTQEFEDAQMDADKIIFFVIPAYSFTNYEIFKNIFLNKNVISVLKYHR